MDTNNIKARKGWKIELLRKFLGNDMNPKDINNLPALNAAWLEKVSKEFKSLPTVRTKKTYSQNPHQKVTDYTGIVEYERFLQERLDKKAARKQKYQGYWHFTDEKLLGLKRDYEEIVNMSKKSAGMRQLIWITERKLERLYDEITRRKL